MRSGSNRLIDDGVLVLDLVLLLLPANHLLVEPVLLDGGRRDEGSPRRAVRSAPVERPPVQFVHLGDTWRLVGQARIADRHRARVRRQWGKFSGRGRPGGRGSCRNDDRRGGRAKVVEDVRRRHDFLRRRPVVVHV